MNKTVRTTLSNIFTVFCCVVICIGIISLVAVSTGVRPFVMISESMHPEVPKNSLVLLDTSSKLSEVAVGDNVACLLGKVEAMHKVTAISTDTGENESGGEAEEAGEAGEKTLVVKSLADEGTSVVRADMYLGKEVMSIAGVGGFIRSVLNYKWIVIGIAGLLIVVGCIPKGKKTENAGVQST